MLVQFSGSGTFFRQLSVTSERMNTEYWLTAKVKSLPGKSVVRIIDRPNMTSAVYHGCKGTNQNKIITKDSVRTLMPNILKVFFFVVKTF